MNKVFKKIGLCAVTFLAALTFASCGNKKTKDTKTTKGGVSTTKSNVSTKKTTKSATTSKTSTKPSSKEYGVTLQNSLSKVSVNVVTMNGTTPTPVDFTKKYAAGTLFYVQVINSSDDQIRISAIMGGKKYDSYLIEGLDIDDEPGYGGLMGVELLGDLTFKVEEASDAEASYLTLQVDDSEDTETLQNIVHVYDPTTLTKKDYVSQQQMEVGQDIEVVLTNYASDVHLTIRNDETTIVDKDFDQLQPGATHETSGTFTFKVGDDVYIDCEVKGEEVTDSEIRIVNFSSADDADITVELYNGETPINTNTVPKGTTVAANIVNSSTTKLLVTAYYDGESDDLLICKSIDSNERITFDVEAANSFVIMIEDYVEYTITYSQITGIDVEIVVGTTVITSGTTVCKYSTMYPTATNSTSKDYAIVVYYDDEMVFTTSLYAGTTFADVNGIIVENNMNIVLVEKTNFNVTIVNPINDDDLLSVYFGINGAAGEESTEIELNNGGTIASLTNLTVAVMPWGGCPTGYVLTIMNGDTKVLDKEPIVKNNPINIASIIISGNFSFVIELAE